MPFFFSRKDAFSEATAQHHYSFAPIDLEVSCQLRSLRPVLRLISLQVRLSCARVWRAHQQERARDQRSLTQPRLREADMGDELKREPRRSDVTLQAYPHVDKDDRSDPVAWSNSREQVMREQFIAKERVKLLRQQVIACYRKEGVNHYVNCKHLTTKYLDIIQDRTYGMLKPPGAGATAEENEE